MDKTQLNDIDQYITGFSSEIQAILQEIRAIIKKAAPEAQEAISYQMPTFKMNGNLIHFAAFKNHIGVYPAPTGIEQFRKELSAYKGGKGSVQFPFSLPMPYDLISRIVKYRVQENLERTQAKMKSK